MNCLVGLLVTILSGWWFCFSAQCLFLVFCPIVSPISYLGFSLVVTDIVLEIKLSSCCVPLPSS